MKAKMKTVIILAIVCAVVALGAAITKVHTIDSKLCTNCAECEKSCPEDAISEGVVNGKKVRIIDPKLCTNCGECAKVCPEECISEIDKSKVGAVKAPAAKTSEKVPAKATTKK